MLKNKVRWCQVFDDVFKKVCSAGPFLERKRNFETFQIEVADRNGIRIQRIIRSLSEYRGISKSFRDFDENDDVAIPYHSSIPYFFDRLVASIYPFGIQRSSTTVRQILRSEFKKWKTNETWIETKKWSLLHDVPENSWGTCLKVEHLLSTCWELAEKSSRQIGSGNDSRVQNSWRNLPGTGMGANQFKERLKQDSFLWSGRLASRLLRFLTRDRNDP